MLLLNGLTVTHDGEGPVGDWWVNDNVALSELKA